MASTKSPLGPGEHVIFSYTTDDGIDDGLFTDLTKPLGLFLRMDCDITTFKFDPARIVVTQGVMALIKVGPMVNVPALVPLLARHLAGDWGNTCPADWAANDRDLGSKTGRLFSSYLLDKVKIWIITEPTVTTILLPSEY